MVFDVTEVKNTETIHHVICVFYI